MIRKTYIAVLLNDLIDAEGLLYINIVISIYTENADEKTNSLYREKAKVGLNKNDSHVFK